MKLSNLAYLTVVGIAASGCGGGGGGSDHISTTPTPTASSTPAPAPAPTPAPTPTPTPTPTPSSANVHGVFDVNFGYQTVYAFLDTGEFYGLDLIGGAVAGLQHGTLSGTGSQFSAPAITLYNFYDVAGGIKQQGNMNVTYTDPILTSINTTFPNPTGFRDGFTITSKTYGVGDTRTIYDNPLGMSTLAGSYTVGTYTVGVTMTAGTQSPLVIAADGSYSFSISNCVFNGALTQLGTTGVFSLPTTVTGTGCPYAGQMTGLLTPLAQASSSIDLAFQLISQDTNKSMVLRARK